MTPHRTSTKVLTLTFFFLAITGLVAYKSGAFELGSTHLSLSNNGEALIDSPDIKQQTQEAKPFNEEREDMMMRGSKSGPVIDEKYWEEMRKAEKEKLIQDSIEKAKKEAERETAKWYSHKPFRWDNGDIMFGGTKSSMVIPRQHPVWSYYDSLIKQDSIRQVHKALLDSAIK